MLFSEWYVIQKDKKSHKPFFGSCLLESLFYFV